MAKSGSGGWSKRRTTSRSNASKSWNQRSTFTTNTNKGQTRSTSVGSGSKGNRTRTTISTNLSTGKTKRIMTVTTGMGTKRINMSPTPKPMKTMKVRKSKAKAWKPKKVSRSRRYASSSGYDFKYTPRTYAGDDVDIGPALLTIFKLVCFLIGIIFAFSISWKFGSSILFVLTVVAIWNSDTHINKDTSNTDDQPIEETPPDISEPTSTEEVIKDESGL
jgi:hypothetical protein